MIDLIKKIEETPSEKALRYWDFRDESFKDTVEEGITTPAVWRYVKGFAIPIISGAIGYAISREFTPTGAYRAGVLTSGAVSLAMCCITGSKESNKTLLGYRIGMGSTLSAFFI